MLRRLRVLFLPFVVSTVLLCVLYTFFHWLLLIKLQLFAVDDFVINFVLPAIATVIPTWFYIGPRLKYLNLANEKRDLRSLYSFIVFVALIPPVVIAQYYVDLAAGKLTVLASVEELRQKEATKYYSVKSLYPDKQNAVATSDFEVTGRYNEHFDMRIYIAIPVLSDSNTTTGTGNNIWLGRKFYKQINNRLETEEKEKAYKEFANESQKTFDGEDYSHFVYLERVGKSDYGDHYKTAIEEAKLPKPKEAVVLSIRNESFEERLGSLFPWIFGSFGIGALLWLIAIVIPKFDESERVASEQDDTGSFSEFLDILKPQPGFVITPIIIYVNVAIYVAMVVAGLGFVSFKSADLLKWGANFRPSTVNGEWWRLVTSTFLHGGIIHLLANMYGLLFVGVFLEPILGKVKYAIAYLLTGIIASIASLWWYDATVSVGASGAIFGLYGMFIAFLLTKVFTPEFAKSFLLSTGIFVGINLLMGLTGGIDNAAHIGGLISGLAVGFLLRLTLTEFAEDPPTGQQ